MLATSQPAASGRRARRSAQDGVAAVEFSIIAIVFFLLVFGTIEIARITYMYNTLAEATRSAARAAANISFNDANELKKARQRAIFHGTDATLPDGTDAHLPFGNPITYQNIRIDYLAITDDGSGGLVMTPVSTPPSCPSKNRNICLANPYANNCIRLVRARVCNTANTASCDPVPYEMLFPLTKLGVKLPISTTIVTAETLGYSPGSPVCP